MDAKEKAQRITELEEVISVAKASMTISGTMGAWVKVRQDRTVIRECQRELRALRAQP